MKKNMYEVLDKLIGIPNKDTLKQEVEDKYGTDLSHLAQGENFAYAYSLENVEVIVCVDNDFEIIEILIRPDIYVGSGEED